VRREFDFETPGKIGISEEITFTYRGLATSGLEYTPATPNGPWSFFTSHEYDKTTITLVETPKEYFRFKLPTKKPGDEVVLKFKYVVIAAATPTQAGAVYDFFPYCTAIDCEQKFKNLPLGSRIDFYEQERETGAPGKILKSATGQNFELKKNDFASTRFFRIEMPGELVRSQAAKAWSAAEAVTRLTTKISLHDDQTIRQDTSIAFQKIPDYRLLITTEGPELGERYLFRNLEGIRFANLHYYTDSTMLLAPTAKSVGFDIKGATSRSPSGETVIRLPISPITSTSYNATLTQSELKYISYHNPIQVNLPPNIKVTPSLWECKKYNYGKCEFLRPLATKVSKNESGLAIEPHEAQVIGLWWLELHLTEGNFVKPSFMTELKFAFGHYHAIGHHPEWVFWFYLFAIAAGLILLIVIFVMLKRAALRRAAAKKHKGNEDTEIAQILKRDPDFDVDAFKARGREIATRIQDAWCAGDMRPVRRFLSQGVYNRFRLQLKIMREFEKKQNAMADFQINGFYIDKRRRSGEFDCLVVRLEAEARDTTVGTDKTPEQAKALAKSAGIIEFVEYYSFMRRSDAKTLKTASFDACAHCGTPFKAEGETNKCKSCGAVMGSGEFDWVLAEITQEVEYSRNGSTSKIAGDMSADRIEDRASFVFWRDIMARVSGQNQIVARDAIDDYLQKSIPQQKLSEIAVGAADLEYYEDALSPIEAKVRIKWSASENGSAIRHRQSILTLHAKPSEETGVGFAEHSCGSCGGPLPETDSEACSYCRSPIQKKNKDWLLAGVNTTVE